MRKSLSILAAVTLAATAVCMPAALQKPVISVAVADDVPTTAMHMGDTGEDVAKLQNRLAALGYYTGTVDSSFGKGTYAAVKAFQANNGLTVDGRAGSATLTKLFSSSAVPASAATETPEAASVALHQGDTGALVLKLQNRLKELGYYGGLCDASFGEGTFNAVKAFQTANGLKVDGRAGSATLTRLYSSSAISASEAQSTSGATDMPTTALHMGATGTEVKSLQLRLKALGYYTGTVDSSYGAGTYAAVKKFQAANGLTVDGRAGSATLTLLYSDAAISSQEANPTETPSNIVPSRVLQQGDKGNDVGSLQSRLAVLGYYTGIVDHSFGAGTKAAVAAFQNNCNLTVTGIADTTTVHRLFSSDAPSAACTPEPTVTTYNIPTRTLSRGDIGEDVANLQNRLKALGWYTGYVDSSFGAGTQSAVIAFQKKVGYDATGIADTATIKKLFSSSAPKAPATPTAIPKVTPARILKYGSTGADVLSVQYRLQKLGWYTGALDSSYGKGTLAAVKRFQTMAGLTADGTVGTKTTKKLYSSSAPTAPTYTVAPQATSESGYPLPTRSLRYGMKGTDVRNLQLRLKELGWYTGAIDSSFGAGTLTAVKSFQTMAGLTADGSVGTATAAKLYSNSAPYAN